MDKEKVTKAEGFSVLSRRGRLLIAWNKRIYLESNLYLHTAAGYPDTPVNRALVAQLATRTLLSLPVGERHFHETLNQRYKEVRNTVVIDVIGRSSRRKQKVTVAYLWGRILKLKAQTTKESTYASKWAGQYSRLLEPLLELPVDAKLIRVLVSSAVRINSEDRAALLKALKKEFTKVAGEVAIASQVFLPFAEWSDELVRKSTKDEFDKKCYTPVELESIFAFFESQPNRNDLLILTIRLLYALGCRPAELAGLQRKHFSLSLNELEICQQYNHKLGKLTTTKTGKCRTLKLTSATAELICDCIVGSGYGNTESFLLPLQNNPKNVQHIYDAWSSPHTGIPVLVRQNKVTQTLPLYSLRHAFITHALARGNKVEDVAHQSGHSVATCQKYYADISGAGKEPLI